MHGCNGRERTSADIGNGLSRHTRARSLNATVFDATRSLHCTLLTRGSVLNGDRPGRKAGLAESTKILKEFPSTYVSNMALASRSASAFFCRLFCVLRGVFSRAESLRAHMSNSRAPLSGSCGLSPASSLEAWCIRAAFTVQLSFSLAGALPPMRQSTSAEDDQVPQSLLCHPGTPQVRILRQYAYSRIPVWSPLCVRRSVRLYFLFLSARITWDDVCTM